MDERRMRTLAILTFAASSIAPATADPQPPTLAVGQCVESRVASIASRLVGDPDSGTYVALTNGIATIGYQNNPQASLARVGDTVTACLVAVPDGCPKGDDRGKVYTIIDHRTKGSWTLPNDEHSCGGA